MCIVHHALCTTPTVYSFVFLSSAILYLSSSHEFEGGEFFFAHSTTDLSPDVSQCVCLFIFYAVLRVLSLNYNCICFLSSFNGRVEYFSSAVYNYCM